MESIEILKEKLVEVQKLLDTCFQIKLPVYIKEYLKVLEDRYRNILRIHKVLNSSKNIENYICILDELIIKFERVIEDTNAKSSV